MFDAKRRAGAKVALFSALVLLIFSVALLRFASLRGAYALGSRSAYCAAEVQTGQTLRSFNEQARLPMASTTKIMTALIVCEECDIDKVVTVPDCAVGKEGSSIYLKHEEVIDVRDLLYGLMLHSGNDAAEALAIIHSGSTEKFVSHMNERARQLGAVNTNFCNPSGLPDENHYTTASDLCRIACYAMHNSFFKKVVGTEHWQGKYRSYANKNKMLYNYDGANGIKTGYTKRAGRCLVSSAERGGMEVVCVVLNVGDMYERSAAILDDCFNSYEVVNISPEKIFICGKQLCRIMESATVINQRGKRVEYSCVPSKDYSPMDGIIGKLQIYCQNDLIFEANLYSIV